VDFLLLAGDLYDGTWRDYNTGLFFIDRMHRLRKAGIRVFLVSGNHDAASRITKALRLPENVVHFSSSRPQTVQIEECGVAVHGQSYSRRAVSDNLALAYPDPVPHLFNIGLLHTGLSGRPGHEPYAPCSREELIHKGYDYWALGHVHQREEVCRDPWIIFPGNLQGRHIRETGPRGATLVQVDDDRVCGVSGRELDVVRWSFCVLDCRDVASEADLLDIGGQVFRQELERVDGRPLILRLSLEGACPFHGELLRDSRFWENSLEALALDCGELWLEKILFQTSRVEEVDPVAMEGSPLAGFLRNLDEGALELFEAADLQTLTSRLPAELLREQPLVPEDTTARRILLQEIRDMVLARILNPVQR
jgi:DNA repair exonuclease SbcCD nuclease subunit